MPIKFEKKALPPTGKYRKYRPHHMEEFLAALRDMEVGESFVTRMTSYNRNAISFAQFLLRRRFATREEARGGMRRICRTE